MLEYQASKVIGQDLEGTDLFKIQCKNHQGYCSIGTIAEVRGLRDGDIPVLISKGNKLEPMVVFPFRDFVRILEVVYGLREAWEVFPSGSALPIPTQRKQVEAARAMGEMSVEISKQLYATVDAEPVDKLAGLYPEFKEAVQEVTLLDLHKFQERNEFAPDQFAFEDDEYDEDTESFTHLPAQTMSSKFL